MSVLLKRRFTQDLPAARQAVAMIVGRNSAQLDTAGISRAAIESLAENTSDGVTAPLFWGFFSVCLVLWFIRQLIQLIR